MKTSDFLRFCARCGLIPVVSLLAGCGGGGDDGSVIKVGEYASLTGSEASFGISSHEGTVLAIEEINAAGGVLGKTIRLLTEDDQSKAGQPATVVNKLIARDRVVAVLGEVASSKSLEAAPICQANKIPMISPASTNPKVTETGDYIFRVCFIDPFQGTVMANFAHKTLQARRIAVLGDAKSDYSKGLTKYFKERVAENGGEIALELNYNGGDKDFKSQLTAIKAAGPQAVFVPGYYNEVAMICRQAKELGLAIPMFGGDGWESEKLVEIGGDALEGHCFSTHYSPDQSTGKVKEFVDAYKKRYNGKMPDTMAALGYDSAYVLVDAMRRAGTTEAAKLRDAIAATRGYVAVTGTLTLDAARNATKSVVILQVQGGKFRHLETIDPQ